MNTVSIQSKCSTHNSIFGGSLQVIEGCQQLDRETRVFGLPSDFKEGVIFSTYATLVSSVQKGSKFTSPSSRTSQILHSLNPSKLLQIIHVFHNFYSYSLKHRSPACDYIKYISISIKH